MHEPDVQKALHQISKINDPCVGGSGQRGNYGHMVKMYIIFENLFIHNGGVKLNARLHG